MKFKVGDKVKIIGTTPGCTSALGLTCTIKRIDSGSDLAYHVEGLPLSGAWYFSEYQLELITEEKSTMSKKYYRVVKEHPVWVVGAIIENDCGDYSAIDDVFVNDFKGLEHYFETDSVVEQSDWFEQVYPISDLKKKLFGSKKQAQAAAAALYKGDK